MSKIVAYVFVNTMVTGCERDYSARTAVLRFCHQGILHTYTWISTDASTPTCEALERETFATRQSTSKTMPRLCVACCSTDSTTVPQQYHEYTCDLPSALGAATDYGFQATFFDDDSACDERNKSMLLAYRDSACTNTYDPTTGSEISFRGMVDALARISFLLCPCV